MHTGVRGDCIYSVCTRVAHPSLYKLLSCVGRTAMEGTEGRSTTCTPTCSELVQWLHTHACMHARTHTLVNTLTRRHKHNMRTPCLLVNSPHHSLPLALPTSHVVPHHTSHSLPPTHTHTHNSLVSSVTPSWLAPTFCLMDSAVHS